MNIPRKPTEFAFFFSLHIIVSKYFMWFTYIIMENKSSSLASKIMSILFIAMGVFFGIYAFFANASTWTLPLGSGWNNITSYIDSTFWSNNPTDDDIITALYGTGDEGSVYTDNRSDYGSGDCLNPWMTVVRTWVIPTTITANTIYVLNGWTYTISAPIEMAECSAITATGDVTIEKNGVFDVISMSWIHYSIINDIKIDGNYFNGDGISIFSGDSNTIHSINIAENKDFWIQIKNTHHLKINKANIFDWLSNGIQITDTDKNIFEIFTIYDNGGKGINMEWSDYNTFDTLYTHGNTDSNLHVEYAQYNTFTDVVATWSVNYGIRIISGSDYNTFSGVTVSDNGKSGMQIRNSDFITWTNIFTNNNGNVWVNLYNSNNDHLENISVYNSTFWITLESSSGNNILNTITSFNQYEWISIVNSSYYNVFSWILSYQNIWWGMLISTSSYNELHDLEAYDNNFGLSISDSNSNALDTIRLYSNTGNNIDIKNSNTNIFTNAISSGSKSGVWVSLLYSSGNTFDWFQVFNNNLDWIYMDSSDYNDIKNTDIYNNDNGIYITWGNNNTIKWSHIYDNDNWWIYIWTSLYNILDDNNIHNNKVGINTYNTTSDTITNNKVYSNISWLYFNSSTWSIIDNNYIYTNQYGIYLTWWTNNIFKDLQIHDNIWCFSIYNTSGAILDTIDIHDILWDSDGIFMENTRYSTIKNSHIITTWEQRGISINGWESNMITWTFLSWIDVWIILNSSNNNTIWYSSHRNAIGNAAINMINTTWNVIEYFSWNGTNIQESHWSGLFLYTTYDTYTQANNYIALDTYQSIATLAGNTAIWATFINQFDQLILFSPSYSILISWSNSFTIYGNTWDGKIYPPTSIPSWSKQAVAQETWATNIATFLDTIEIISGNTYLTMNWGTGTITYHVPGVTVGQYLKIFKSNDGSTWTNNMEQSGCIVDNTLICEFDFVGDVKLFAFWVPTNLSFTGYTLDWALIQSGWYYNTGVYITFTGNYISGAILDGNPYANGTHITTNGTHTFIVTDEGNNSTGITFTIDTTVPTVTVITPISGAILYTGVNVYFEWTGDDNTNISGYTLYIDWPVSHTIPLTTTGYTLTSMLNNWLHTWYVVATDIAGNTWSSIPRSFTIKAPFSGQIVLTWPNTKYISTQRFTKDYANISMQANDPVDYTISGQHVVGSPLTWSFIWSVIYSATLTWANGRKDIFVNMTNNSWENISGTFTVYLDTVASTPTLISPTSGSTITSSTFTLSRDAWADAVWLSGYQYFISPTDTFWTILASWSTTSNSANINSSTLWWAWTYYRYVTFIDRLGNTSSSVIRNFVYSWVTDTTPDDFHFSDIDDADLNEVYISNTVTITGMAPGVQVLASINKWMLYISWNAVGTTWYVQNWWTVKIELISSDEYDEEVSSTLTIGNEDDTFTVTTKEWSDNDNYDNIDTDLSNSEKLMIIAIFETLRDLYNGDKEEEFFNTIMLMLDEKMDEYDTSDDEYIALKYLYDLIEQYYDDGEFWDDTLDLAKWVINGTYTAPNGKKYKIAYDSSTKRFTSTNFVVPKYFPTLDTLKYIIDINNPAGSQYVNAKPILARWKNANIDGTRQTSPYTAPNKKVFYFFKDITERYSSYTFTSERYFNSLNDVKEFIYNSNKK